MAEKLETYQRMRRFNETPEPSGKVAAKKTASAKRKPSSKQTDHALSFVIQEHDARRLHYDFRLELDGTLKSWAVPKGPSLDPSVKRLAVHVEDHPLDYGSFEGEIPEGNYGAGSVIVWDRGTWEPQTGSIAEASEAYAAGKLKFRLDGEKLHGGWTLVRSHMRGSGDKEQWLLIKERDEDARNEADYDILLKQPGSVLTDSLGARNKKGQVIERPERKAGARKTAKAPAKQADKSARPDIVANRNTESLRELAHEPSIEGAVKAKLPATFKPQLATLVDAAPTSGDWAYEIKFDGYRVLARIDRASSSNAVQVWTRNGNDWTTKFSKQVKALGQLEIDSAWLDGEAVVLDDRGLPDFQALQNAFDAGRPQDIVVYWFDVPFLNGYDLRHVPLVQRRAILQALLERVGDPTLRFSERLRVQGRRSAEKRLRHGARRHHRQARGQHVCVGAQQRVDQAQVPSTPGVRDRRLFGAGGQPRDISARCCSACTTPTASCSTRGAWAPASTSRRSPASGSNSTSARQARCRSRASRSNAAARRCTG